MIIVNSVLRASLNGYLSSHTAMRACGIIVKYVMLHIRKSYFLKFFLAD